MPLLLRVIPFGHRLLPPPPPRAPACLYLHFLPTATAPPAGYGCHQLPAAPICNAGVAHTTCHSPRRTWTAGRGQRHATPRLTVLRHLLVWLVAPTPYDADTIFCEHCCGSFKLPAAQPVSGSSRFFVRVSCPFQRDTVLVDGLPRGPSGWIFRACNVCMCLVLDATLRHRASMLSPLLPAHSSTTLPQPQLAHLDNRPMCRRRSGCACHDG